MRSSMDSVLEGVLTAAISLILMVAVGLLAVLCLVRLLGATLRSAGRISGVQRVMDNDADYKPGSLGNPNFSQ
jgi:hypothetical protein